MCCFSCTPTGDATGCTEYSFTTAAVDYCASSGSTQYKTGVVEVALNDLLNADTDNQNAAYEDFTAMSATVSAGSTHALNVKVDTDGAYNVNSKVWIDWNKDFDFNDEGEEIDMGNANNVAAGLTSFSPYSLTIPAAALGDYRMRVAAAYYNANPPTSYPAGPCENGYDGEVEDYTITITAPCNCDPSCSPLPTASGTYTATTNTTDANGYTHYCDAAGSLLLSVKVPAGWTIPPAAVSLEIGSSSTEFISEYCGADASTGCFVKNVNGTPILNRKWYVNPNSITKGGFAFVNVVYYFTQTEYNAVNNALSANTLTQLGSYTEMEMFKIKDFTNTLGTYPAISTIAPWYKVNYIINNTTPGTTKWLGNNYTGATTGYSAEFQVFDFNGGGGIGARLK